MQILEELEQCHKERRAALQLIRSLTEENEELKKELHPSHPDDTHTDMETTGIMIIRDDHDHLLLIAPASM